MSLTLSPAPEMGLFTALAEKQGSVFSTWEGFEVDKCASMWLIKRYIDKDAEVKILPKGEFIKEGIPFDTPDATFRRYHNLSTFESLLKHYNLRDPKLIEMGKIIHEIEINIWGKNFHKETPFVQDEVSRIIRESKSNSEVIEKCNDYFDSLFERIESEADR